MLVLFYATLVLLFLRPSFLKFATPLGRISLTSAKNPAFAFSFLWLVAALMDPRRYLTRSGLEGPLLLFLVVISFSAIFSHFGTGAERGAAFLEFVLYCTFFYASLHVVRTTAAARGIVLMLFALAVVAASVNLAFHYRRGIWVILDQGYPFWDGKNALGLFMVFALSMGTTLIVPPRPATEAKVHSRKGWRFLLVLPGLFLVLLCLVYSYSRGAWLAAIGAVLTFGILRSWKWVTLMLFAVLLLVFLPHKKAFHRLLSIPRMADGNVAKRITVWKGAVNMIGERPLFGVGPGEFRTAYRQHDTRAKAATGTAIDRERMRFSEHAHNLFLQVAVETGLPGVIALVWGLVVIFRLALHQLKRPLDQSESALVKSLLAALTAFLVFSLADCSWTGRLSGSSFMHINLVVILLVVMLVASRASPVKGAHT